MAEQPKPEGKTVVLLNRGLRSYKTSVGLLEPGSSVSLPEAEAKGLMVYRDLVDAAKAMPQQAAKHKALEDENAKLKKQLADLSSGDHTARIKELEAALEAGEKENARLTDQVEKLQAKVEKLKDK